MSFQKYVNHKTISLAGFNGWEPSMGFSVGKKSYLLYCTRHYPTGFNIAVIEEDVPDAWNQDIFYFRTFEGPEGEGSGDFNTEEEEEAFLEVVRSTICKEYRFDGKDLEDAMLKALEELDKK